LGAVIETMVSNKMHVIYRVPRRFYNIKTTGIKEVVVITQEPLPSDLVYQLNITMANILAEQKEDEKELKTQTAGKDKNQTESVDDTSAESSDTSAESSDTSDEYEPSNRPRTKHKMTQVHLINIHIYIYKHCIYIYIIIYPYRSHQIIAHQTLITCH
jgi:hypothetical protein